MAPIRKADMDNGYTPIANDLLRAKMALNMSGADSRVWDCLAWLTYGFADSQNLHTESYKKRRELVKVSASVIAQHTRLAVRVVQRSLQRLTRAQVLICVPTKGRANAYGINPKIGEWRATEFPDNYQRAVTFRPEAETAPVAIIETAAVTNPPTETPAPVLEKPREARTAKAPAGDKTPAPTRQLLDGYSQAFEARYGFRPLINWAEDNAKAKRLVDAYGLEVMLGAVKRFLADNNPALVEGAHPFGWFVKRVNQYVAAITRTQSHPSSSGNRTASQVFGAFLAERQAAMALSNKEVQA